MVIKRYNVHSNRVELFCDVAEEKNFDSLLELLKLFELNTCICSYDKDLINLTVINGKVNVEVIEKKTKFFRTIYLKEIEVVINSDDTLKNLLRIVMNYDAMLSIKPKDEPNSKTIFVVNDNGHNYINFDNSKYDLKEIKTKISQILG